jgi:hypothetical protein
VFVHTREFDVRLISDPAGIDPVARSDPDVPFVTVLPLAVVVGVLGFGAGFVVVELDVLLGVVRAGARVTGALVDGVVTGVVVAGTSCSAGCAAVS